MAKLEFTLPELPTIPVLDQALQRLHPLREYVGFLKRYFSIRGYAFFSRFEGGKDILVDLLYKKRGKYARPFLHFGLVGLAFLVITLGPIILQNSDQEIDPTTAPLGVMQSASAQSESFYTLQSEEVRQYRGGEVIVHTVQDGETLSSIAQRYGLEPTTIIWENNLNEKAVLKPGQELRILPVNGIRHKVARGETIYTVGKKYGLDENQVQTIIDYPFNEFLNDETFELATGQFLVVPEGVKPDTPAASLPRTRVAPVLTPDAGSVTALGTFVWPTSGQISQGYQFYHKAVDISNRAGGPILAADSGTITVAGWVDNSGYGNRIMIDHGNGFVSLYAHLSVVQVQVGQRVNRGDVIGQMGSTGRSTGTHLHFEIRRGGVLDNPLSYLR